MLSTEFEPFFHRYRDFYLGCFSSDNYPRNFTRNFQFFIVNTQSSSELGKHWLAVLFKNNVIELFDSGGSNEKTVQQFLKFNKSFECVFNETVLQPLESNSCGQFCVFFLLKRLMEADLSMSKVLNTYFTHDVLKNNQKVEKFCANYFSE